MPTGDWNYVHKVKPAAGALDKLMSGSKQRSKILVDDKLREEAVELSDDILRDADGIGEHVLTWLNANRSKAHETLGLTKLVPYTEKMVMEHLANSNRLTAENASRILNGLTERLAQEIEERLAAIEAKHGTILTVEKHDGSTIVLSNPHELMPELLRHVSLRLDTALIGPSGSGKTTAARQVAEVLELPFYFIACSDSDMPNKWFGYRSADGTYVDTQVYRWFTQGGVLLVDEYDNMRDSIGVNLNAMLDNGLGDFPNGAAFRHPDAICIAAGNTVGRGATGMYRARRGLDESTIERFAFLEWGYDETLEMVFAKRSYWTKLIQAIRAIVTEKSMAYLVTPRATINGDKLLGTGLGVRKVLDRVVFKGWPRDDIIKVTSTNSYERRFDDAMEAHARELVR